MLFFLSSLVLVGALLTGPIAAIPFKPCIELSSQTSLLDQEIVIKFSSLQPNEVINIQAETLDDNGLVWASYGVFQANDVGEIDLSKQSPIEGSYTGTDPVGLLWSMEPSASERGASFKIKKESFCVKITAYRDKEEIASQDIIRLRREQSMQKIVIEESGLKGILFLPSSPQPLPAIITLTGSNGGFGENRAQLLASHGFAVLALGYFGVEGLPANLQDIPLEYFEAAFAWLKKDYRVDGSRVGIYGASRGAELALILGSWFPDSVQAIAAVVPSSVVYGGLGKTPVDAWLYHGKPVLPFAPVPQTDFSGDMGKDPAHPANTLQSFSEGMKDEKAFEAAAIPVEKIQASLLLISGGDDQMWPSSLYALQI